MSSSSGISPEAPKLLFVLKYTYVSDILEKRAPHRSAHLDHANNYLAKGSLIAGGAFVPPTDGALFLFQNSDKTLVEDFVSNDPYVKSKLVSDFSISPWTVVIGNI
jgi:uncharacterized protein YciI